VAVHRCSTCGRFRDYAEGDRFCLVCGNESIEVGCACGRNFDYALTVGLRYGRGLLYMKNQPHLEVFWQGPSIGWDVGGNGSRVFTLCYNLQYPDAVFRRFPGVEGTAYLVGGMGVNYQRAEDITLAPIRAGVGLRLGANIGYLSYSRKRRILPF